MKYDEVIEAIKDSIKYKKLMADAGGGGGAGAGGGAAGGSGGASAGGTGASTGASGDGGSADGGGSDATPSADSTSSEPTSQRGGYFAGYGGYWASKGSSKKKKKKKAKAGSVKDGIYEGDVIDAKNRFAKKDEMFTVHIYTTDQTGRSEWIKPFRFRNQYEVSRNVQNQLDKGVKPEHIKVSMNGTFMNMPEFGITENINNLQEEPNVEALENKKYELEGALSRAREITKDIKYVDTHVEIVSRLGTLAEEVGLQLDDYNERQVYAAKNQLESAIYELEEVFEDAIRDISNKIDDLEYQD